MLSLVSGGAGFLGSHLINALVDDGDRVVVIDNLSSGYVRNLEHAVSSGRATFVYADVATSYAALHDLVGRATNAPLDRVFHLASPASRVTHETRAWETLEANGPGTMLLVQLALAHGARFLFASSAAVYGAGADEPQSEAACGNVDPVGVRSCYDEAKRFGEAVVAAAIRTRELDGRIVRLFNCYGPGMDEEDGRLVPELFRAAFAGKPLPIYGSGEQTRCLMYVDDAVSAMRTVMESAQRGVWPVNVGTADERSVEQIARAVARISGVDFVPAYLPARASDPARRTPDLGRARTLGILAATPLEEGLRSTYRWLREDRLAFA